MTTSRIRRWVALAAVCACGAAGPAVAQAPAGPVQQITDVFATAAPPPACGPGSDPETGLQGDVPAADRDNGRSARGYHCNLTRLGGYPGRGGGITSTSFDHCAYVGSFFPGDLLGPAQGVQVLDVADPENPVLTTTLTEPAMLAGTWESLKVNTTRKLLVGTGVPALTGVGLIAVYDVSDCAHPRLLNPGPGSLAMPLPITAHEGGFSPDGNTYWSSGTAPGIVSAIDLTDPANPHVIWQGMPGLSMHGMGVSPDGDRLYLSNNMGGITILDTSAVQRRDPNPVVPVLSQTSWTDGWATQHSIPVTYGGKPYLFTVDEAGSGGVKFIDVADPARPRLIGSIKLAINLPENQDAALASSMGGSLFAYDPHYCAADRAVDPTALACGWESSGVRVFDVRDPGRVREIAYYNPPALTGHNAELSNSPHALASLIGVPVLSAPSVMQALAQGVFDPARAVSPRSGDIAFGDLSADWCFSAPEWRGNQLWVTCADNGFQALELSPDVYTPPANQHSTVGA
ncbi:LVIVD repeat-containing protein [Nocardia sp. NPDC003482]